MRKLLTMAVVLCALDVMAQTPLSPLEPFTPIEVLDGSMHVDGVWGIAGHLEYEHEVAVSSIFCFRADQTCTESVHFDGDVFQNTADYHT
jgi:hypothetical protein